MRPLNRVISLVLGGIITGAAVLTGIETVLLAAGQPAAVVPRARWATYLGHASWTSTWIEIPAIVLLAAGAVIGLAQLVPRRPVRLAARSTPTRQVWLSRRGLARRIAADVGRLSAVDDARVKIGRHRVRARVTATTGSSAREVRAHVERAVRTTVDQLGVTARLRTRTKVRVDDARVR